MKKLALLAIAASMATTFQAQPKLEADNVEDVLDALTLEEKIHLCIGGGTSWINLFSKFPGTAGNSYAVERLGITPMYYCDGPHGISMTPERPFDTKDYIATEFPMATALAATWDCKAVNRIGEALGAEVRDYGLDIILAPGINIHRNALCGRNHEYYSEDPVLAGMLSAAYINGVQSVGTGTSLKHFAANNQESNRYNNDSRVSQRALREIYLKCFEIAVKQSNPWTIMSSYNYINGIRTTEHRSLVTELLHGEWGYQGLVMSDWGAGTDAVAAMHAGTDILQPGNRKQFSEIRDAVKEGRLDEKQIDENVRRLLRLVVKTHTFQQFPYNNEPDLKSHQALVRQIGAESMVLLKNDGNVLPIKGCRVALYGSNSYAIVSQNIGIGTTMTVQHKVVSLVEGLRKGGFTVNDALMRKYYGYVKSEKARRDTTQGTFDKFYHPWTYTEMKVSPKSQVNDNDVAIITINRNSTEGTDRRPSEFDLTEGERKLIQDVSDVYHAAGKKVIVLLNVCGPVEVASWRNQVDAILCTWQTGGEIGNSIVDVLLGKTAPCGRLPMTWSLRYGDALADKNFPQNFEITKLSDLGNHPWNNPKIKDIDYTNYDEGIYVGYRYFTTQKKEMAYPFGFGLSYTTFEYSNPVIKSTPDGFEASITVTNTGSTPAREVVQLYITAPKGGLDKPVVELKSFAKTRTLKAGENQTLTMKVSNYELASFNEKRMQWETSQGNYLVLFAKNASDAGVTANYRVNKKQSWSAPTKL